MPLARRPRGRLVAALAAAALALIAALSPPGDAVADWVRTAVGLRPHAPAGGVPAADRLPSGGRLLVTSGGSAWIVEASGKRRRLGAWTGASWSPHGRFVVVWRGRRLAAVDRRGRVRWSLLAPRPVTSALWSPSGFRVAYRSGQDLRVVAGDGTGDRLLDPGTFRPHGLAARRGARARVRCRARTSTSSTSTAGRRLARIRLPHVPHEIAWSADGRRLYVNLHRSLAIYDASGRRTGRIWMPRPPDRHDLRPRPQRHARGGRAAERGVERGRADGPGRARPRAVPRRRPLHPPALLAVRPLAARRWPLADQWVFLRPGAAGARRVLAAPDVTRRIGSPGFPQLERLVLPAVSLARAGSA